MKVHFREPGLLRRVVVHVGPTNSGKTHQSIHDLLAVGHGVYAAPLRQLAREVYESLSEAAPGRVGLVTGEEQINPTAPIICATTQAAPTSGRALVLDEAHWVHDAQHGHAWTRLLTCGRFETMSVITAEHGRHAVLGLLPDVEVVEVVEHERLATLVHAGATTLRELPGSTALIAFSRTAVLDLAGRLRADGREVSVLYGALPPDTRRDQLTHFAQSPDGVMVTTDVIGHGVNLPIDAVVFSEIRKYDGRRVRPLMLWEAAQLAGRAGRFGHSTSGRVLELTGARTSRWLDLKHVVDVAAGSASAPVTATLPRLSPTLGELGCTYAGQLTGPDVRRDWARTVKRQRGARRVVGAIAVDLASNLAELHANHVLTKLTVKDAWALAATRIHHPLLQLEAVNALVGRAEVAPGRLVPGPGPGPGPAHAAQLTPRLDRMLQNASDVIRHDLRALESAALLARGLSAFAAAFPEAAPFSTGEALAVERTLAGHISVLLDQQLRA